MTTREEDAAPRSLAPRNRARSPGRARVDNGLTLDATVDALAVSGVKLEVVDLDVTRGFFIAERAGGGGRRARKREEEDDDEGRGCKWSTEW